MSGEQDLTPGAPQDRAVSGRITIAMFCVIVCFYALGLNSHWRFQRDSVIYMDLARSLVEGRGYVHNYEPHTKYSPGLPVILAAVGKVGGMPETPGDSFLLMNLAETLMGLGCIVLLYLILKELKLPDEQVFIAAALFGLSRTLYYYSAHIMTDVPFAFLALAALWCGVKMLDAGRRAAWGWCGAAAALAVSACAVRPVGPLLAVALLLGLWARRGALRRWKGTVGKTLLILLILAVTLVAWSAFTHSAAPDGAVHYFRRRLSVNRVIAFSKTLFLRPADNLRGLTDTVCGTELGWPVGAGLALLMAVGVIRALRRREVMFTFFGVMCMGVVLAGGWTLGRRYMLPALPMMCYWLVLGSAAAGCWLRERMRFWNARRVRGVGYVCLTLLLGLNLVRIGKVIRESRSPDFYRIVDDGRVADYAAVCRWLRDNAKPEQTVLAYESTTIHYFSRIRTVQLAKDTRGKKLTWLLSRARKQDIRYLVRDPRKEESIAVLDRLIEKAPRGFRSVLKTGKVQLLEVNRRALRRSAPHM